MPMLSNYAENELLDYLTGTLGSHLSLHDGIPGETGADEISGGSYARQAITFGAAVGGVADSSLEAEFGDMPGVEVWFAGYWDDLSAGNFLMAVPLGAAARGFASAIASTDTFTSPAHGLNDDDRVWLQAVAGVGNLPAGLSESVLYHVVGAAANTFQLSTTQGGSAENFTTDGDVIWIRVVPRMVTAGDAVRFPVGSVSLRLD